MCTLTFVPKPVGYILGMNRDESVLRPAALPPTRFIQSGVEAVYPRESATGGTWVAANSDGIAFALLNQNRGPGSGPKLRSRGNLIPALVHGRDMRAAIVKLEQMDLNGLFPFLLTGFFPAEKTILEWQWNGKDLTGRPLSWGSRHWFSSGISDAMAAQVRGAFCTSAWQRRDAGSAEWLRRMHASHSPVRGSFSVCVHRPEAATVSYTEVSYDGEQVDLRYHVGQPCQALGRFDHELTLANRRYFAAAS